MEAKTEKFNKNYQIPFQNKILVLIDIINKGNYSKNDVGMYSKSVHDILKHLYWLKSGVFKNLIVLYLEMTDWIVKHPGEEIYFPMSKIICACQIDPMRSQIIIVNNGVQVK